MREQAKGTVAPAHFTLPGVNLCDLDHLGDVSPSAKVLDFLSTLQNVALHVWREFHEVAIIPA